MLLVSLSEKRLKLTSNKNFSAVQTAAWLVESFETFFDHLFWQNVANPQSGEMEDIVEPELL